VDALSNTLAVIVPASSTARVGGARDLLALRRLALANPEAVPAGVYARSWLVSQGVWDALRDRIVPTLDVRAALAAVASEGVEAGIVYKTDAALSPRVKVALEVPRAAGPPIVYVLATLPGAGDAARAFARELTGARAAAVFERYGFAVLFRR
jgi:molybdate transport system substrate-binding protein